MSNDKLLVAMKDAAEKCKRYSRVVSFLSTLGIVMSVIGIAAIVASAALRLPYWQTAAVGAAALTPLLITDALYKYYYRKSIKEFDRLKRLVHMATLSMKFDQVTAKLEKEIEELEQELKKRIDTGDMRLRDLFATLFAGRKMAQVKET